MHDFKEWLSDNLRYFLVGFVVILIIGGSILGLKIYSSAVNGDDKVTVIQKNTENQETEKNTEKNTEKATQKETQKETKKDTEAQTKKESESESETEPESETQTQSQSSEAYDAYGQADDSVNSASGSDAEVIQPEYQETVTVETDPPKPVYLTLNGACYMRSYPDYGDNIIGQYDAGTTVQFLADVGGWYEVSVDGQVGYMGARFFN